MTVMCMCAEYMLFRECEHTRQFIAEQEAEDRVEQFIAEHLEEVRELAGILEVPAHRAGHVLYDASTKEGYAA